MTQPQAGYMHRGYTKDARLSKGWPWSIPIARRTFGDHGLASRAGDLGIGGVLWLLHPDGVMLLCMLRRYPCGVCLQ